MGTSFGVSFIQVLREAMQCKKQQRMLNSSYHVTPRFPYVFDDDCK